jgi:hypothetical protein
MKLFSANKKILATQIISYLIFALALLGKNFPGIASVFGPYKYFFIAAFFIAQAFMVYFIIQENKQKAAAQNHPKE